MNEKGESCKAPLLEIKNENMNLEMCKIVSLL